MEKGTDKVIIRLVYEMGLPGRGLVRKDPRKEATLELSLDRWWLLAWQIWVGISGTGI